MEKNGDSSPTIMDVAKGAQVSPATVSRVINGSAVVKDSTREKVMKTIEELHFSPNSFARGLMNKKSNIVGIIVPRMRNPYYSELISGIESALHDNGYSMLLCVTNGDEDKLVYHLKALVEYQVEGIVIIHSKCKDQELLDVISRKTCVITIQSKIPGCDSVSSEEETGIYMAINHLLSLGHRKIAYICFQRSNDEEKKISGFVKAFQKYGLACPDELILVYKDIDKTEDELALDAGYLLTKRLLESDNPPTAIQTTNDFYAIGAYHAIMEKGLKIPQDISVCGFDNIEIAKILNPPLTTVEQFADEKGKTCGELLIQRITGNRNFIHRDIILPTSLITRSSTAPPKKD